MEYYSAIKNNTFESILMRWMKLEPIIQSEVSQKEKHQYSILSRGERGQQRLVGGRKSGTLGIDPLRKPSSDQGA